VALPAKSTAAKMIMNLRFNLPPDPTHEACLQTSAPSCLVSSENGVKGRFHGKSTGRRRAAAGERAGLGEQRLGGRPAILDMPVGKGHVVSFNFNPMHRDMNRGDHRLL